MPVRKPIVLHCSVGDGKLEVTKHQWQQVRLALSKWANTPAVLTIEAWQETRRDRQNAFYWLVLEQVVAHEREEGLGSGWSKEDWHEVLKLAFNHKLVIDPQTGEEMRIAKSTTKLTVSEFHDYQEQCLLLFAERYGLVFDAEEKS